MKLLLIHEPADAGSVSEQVLPLLAKYPIDCFSWEDELPQPEPDRRVLTWLSDEALKRLLAEPACAGWQIGLLPHPKMIQARQGLGIASRLEEAIDDILSREQAEPMDLMYCNDQLVLSSVLIGDTYSLKPARISNEPLWMRLQRFLRLIPNLSDLVLAPYQLVTKKEKVVDTAALGIVIVEHGRGSLLTRHILDDTSKRDGKLNALILAPRSIFEFLRFLFATVFLPFSRMANQQPDFIGHIRTSELTLSDKKAIPFLLDGKKYSAETIFLQVRPKAVRLFPGRDLEYNSSNAAADDKETVRLRKIPIGEARTELISYPMPWIHHASSEEVHDLFQTLRENAKASEVYLTLMVLSTLLACIGLYANSSPVLIGAMLLAPLMSPTISMAMALLRRDEKLIRECSKTLAVGIGLSVLGATLFALITPLHVINAEIGARLKPTLLDLGVAIVSGIAGAYAYSRVDAAKSIVGVAIAVALVPPLGVIGIGIGWLSWSVFSGALLLFLTNLAGIILSAALTFLVLGYSPFKRAKKGLVLSLIMVLFVSVPLVLGFRQMVIENRMMSSLNGWQIEGVELRDVSVQLGNPVQVQSRLASPAPVTEAQLDLIKTAIEQKLKQPVQLEAIVSLVR